MATLTLRVGDIPDEGLRLDRELAADDLVLSENDAHVRNALTLTADVSKAGTQVHVSGLLAATVERQCVRCLQEYADELQLPFQVAYHRSDVTGRPSAARKSNPAKNSQRAPEPLDEDDVYTYQGEIVDLADMLREQVILATPMQPLCSPTCRGLCPVCGRDRNVSACLCVEQAARSPFAILAEREPDQPAKDPRRSSQQ